MSGKAKKQLNEVHVYLDPDVYRRLVALAKEADRSLTAQCRVILQCAIRDGVSL
jgi:hypothetical protein